MSYELLDEEKNVSSSPEEDSGSSDETLGPEEFPDPPESLESSLSLESHRSIESPGGRLSPRSGFARVTLPVGIPRSYIRPDTPTFSSNGVPDGKEAGSSQDVPKKVEAVPDKKEAGSSQDVPKKLEAVPDEKEAVLDEKKTGPTKGVPDAMKAGPSHSSPVEIEKSPPDILLEEMDAGPSQLHRNLERYKYFKKSPTALKLSVESSITPLVEDISMQDLEAETKKKLTVLQQILHYVKMICLFSLWLAFTVILMIKSEKEVKWYQISVPENAARSYYIMEHPDHKQLSISLQGAFLPPVYSNMSTLHMNVWLEVLLYKHSAELSDNLSTFDERHITKVTNVTVPWVIPLVSDKNFMEFVPEITFRKTFQLEVDTNNSLHQSFIRLKLKTNLDASFPVAISYEITPISLSVGIIYAVMVLLGLYFLIIFEVVHRTLAAIVASTMSVAILAALDERPTMAELISWVDVETLLLLFSMMMLVAVFSETGIFDYLAVFAYKITSGRVWPLVNTICIFTGILSSFLDNVTTVLLMTPVTIRLCEVMELNPVPILMAMIMYSNIGGAMTPVGDPPNVIIASNPDVIKSGINFANYTLHMGVGIILSMLVVYVYLRIAFRNIKDLRFEEPQDVQELRHEMVIWQRAASSLSSYSKDEDLVRQSLQDRVRRLTIDLHQKLNCGRVTEAYKSTLEELQVKYPIRDKVLLVKSSMSLLFVILLYFLHSIPELNLSLAWIALLGALLLLLLADHEDLEGLLARVEWGTLLFFASLFVLMEALSRLGLIDWIGRKTEEMILSVEEPSRLAVAILLILWVSAAASSFVDNIPLTTMMVRIVTNLSQNEEMNLPLPPLVWALAFGACLGGNGTLIGSSANVVCAGVAEQHGYRFTFMQYFKIGFPVMLVTVTVASFYLLLAHVVLSWH